MRIAVTAPTGNIGRQLTPRLLDGGAEVVLLVRDPLKVKAFTDRGARAESGPLDDAAFVTRATEGADALFWLTPPDGVSDDLHAHQLRIGRAGAAAVGTNRIPRVVVLSSVGAQIPSGTGPIAGLHPVEKLFDGSGAHVAHLRAAFFMENLLMALETIRGMGMMFMPARPDVKLPMVATRDIAAVAATWLLDGTWTGRHVAGIHGPADLSFTDAAEEIGRGIGRPVQYVPVGVDPAREAMLGMGLSRHMVELYLEMYDAVNTGRLVVAEPRTPATTTPTTLAQFAAETMKPVAG